MLHDMYVCACLSRFGTCDVLRVNNVQAGKSVWEGEVADYICTGLLQTEFKFSQFTNHSLGIPHTNTMSIARRSLHEGLGLRQLAVASFCA